MENKKDSLGLIETLGMVAAIEAADAGSKAANVSFRGCQSARAGLITVMFTGDVAAVRAAVTAGSAAASQVGKVVSVHVIARPDLKLHVTPNGSKSGVKVSQSRTPVVAVPADPVAEEVVVVAQPVAEVVVGIEEAIAEETAPTSADAIAEAIVIAEEPSAKEEEIVVVESATVEDENGNGHLETEEEPEEALVAAHAPQSRKKDKVRKPRSKRK